MIRLDRFLFLSNIKTLVIFFNNIRHMITIKRYRRFCLLVINRNPYISKVSCLVINYILEVLVVLSWFLFSCIYSSCSTFKNMKIWNCCSSFQIFISLHPKPSPNQHFCEVNRFFDNLFVDIFENCFDAHS